MDTFRQCGISDAKQQLRSQFRFFVWLFSDSIVMLPYSCMTRILESNLMSDYEATVGRYGKWHV
jgi:hypothetical protein